MIALEKEYREYMNFSLCLSRSLTDLPGNVYYGYQNKTIKKLGKYLKSDILKGQVWRTRKVKEATARSDAKNPALIPHKSPLAMEGKRRSIRYLSVLFLNG